MTRLNTNSFDDPAWAMVTRGAGELAEWKFTDAISSFTEAICAFSDATPTAAIVETFICRGAAFGRSGDHHSAIADFSKAIELSPKRHLAYYNRGYSQELLQQYRQAIDDYTRALSLSNNDVDSYLRRGVCRKKVGDRAGACSDFGEVRRLKRTNQLARNIEAQMEQQ